VAARGAGGFNSGVTGHQFYCTSTPPPDRLAAALGEVGGVLPSSVDLAAPDTVDRDWQAAVLGTLSPMIRIESGWPPDGWYPAEFYHDWLGTRTGSTAPPRTIRAASRWRPRMPASATCLDDGGTALLRRLTDAPLPGPTRSPPSAIGAGWWCRIPRPVPWAEQP
jgi:hypothetical protein